MGKDIDRHFSKKDMQKDNHHMKMCSIFIIREIQRKTRRVYHFPPNRIPIIKMTVIVGEDE